MSKLIISDLFIYPIKSCGSIRLSESKVTIKGLQHDRQWMLVDENNEFITQRNTARLALIRCEMYTDYMEVGLHHTNEKIIIPFIKNQDAYLYKTEKVTIWNDVCEALVYNQIVNQWFSDILDMACKLVFMPEDSKRQVDIRYAPIGDLTTFSDGYPILLLSQASMDFLNAKLEIPLPITRFRPNIVFSGGDQHIEDQIGLFKVNQVQMQGVKLCARCKIPAIDQVTTNTSNEPTSTLATYRLVNKKILFGQNVLVKNEGYITCGDEIVVY